MEKVYNLGPGFQSIKGEVTLLGETSEYKLHFRIRKSVTAKA